MQIFLISLFSSPGWNEINTGLQPAQFPYRKILEACRRFHFLSIFPPTTLFNYVEYDKYSETSIYKSQGYKYTNMTAPLHYFGPENYGHVDEWRSGSEEYREGFGTVSSTCNRLYFSNEIPSKTFTMDESDFKNGNTYCLYFLFPTNVGLSINSSNSLYDSQKFQVDGSFISLNSDGGYYTYSANYLYVEFKASSLAHSYEKRKLAIHGSTTSTDAPTIPFSKWLSTDDLFKYSFRFHLTSGAIIGIVSGVIAGFIIFLVLCIGCTGCCGCCTPAWGPRALKNLPQPILTPIIPNPGQPPIQQPAYGYPGEHLQPAYYEGQYVNTQSPYLALVPPQPYSSQAQSPYYPAPPQPHSGPMMPPSPYANLDPKQL